MIEIKHLDFAYGRKKRPVFRDFSLTLEEGGIYGLLGRNGTGKSTLLYLLCGLLRPQAGKVSVDGTDSSLRLATTLSDVFLVPEEYALEKVSLQQYVRLNRPFYPRFSEEIFQQCLSDFDLTEDMTLGKLSMGQTKKALMCFALATRVRYLLMDEPTNGLDIPSKSQFRRVVAQHLADDQTLIISTHQVGDVNALLDHIVIIDGTQLLLSKSVAEVTSEFVFEERAAGEPTDDALYAQPSVGGSSIVRPNRGDEDTALNLEVLFNYVTSLPKPQKEVLAHNTDASASLQAAPSKEKQKEAFSFSRFCHTLKHDALLHRRNYISMFIGIFIAFMLQQLLSIYSIDDALTRVPDMRFDDFLALESRTIGNKAMIIMAIYMFIVVSLFAFDRKEKTSRIKALMLPASRFEKFATRWLILVPGTLLVSAIAFVCADLLRLAFQSALIEHSLPSFIPAFFEEWNFFPQFSVDDGNIDINLLSYIGRYILLVFVHASYLLGGVVFRKYGALLTTLIYIGAIFLFSWCVAHLAEATNSVHLLQNFSPTVGFYVVLDLLLLAGIAFLVLVAYRRFGKMKVN